MVLCFIIKFFYIVNVYTQIIHKVTHESFISYQLNFYDLHKSLTITISTQYDKIQFYFSRLTQHKV